VAYLRYSALGFDPNDMGLVLAISLPMAWHLSLKCQGIAEKLLYRSYLPLAFFAIMLTGSRGSFVASMVALVYILWTIGHFSKCARLAIFLVLLGGALVLVDRIPTSSWARISTIGQELTSGSLNSRLHIWESAIEAISQDPLLGIGTGAFKVGIENTYGVPISSHNLFLSIWLTLGIVGLLIFLAMLFIALINIFRMPPEKYKLWIVLMATWFVGVMGLNWEFRKPTWVLIGLLICQAVKYQNKEDSAVIDTPGVLAKQRFTENFYGK
jgi:O-antigen ligase